MLTAYVISLPQSTDRRESCFQTCRDIGIEPIWFKAVNGRDLLIKYESNPDAFSGRIDLQDKTVLNLGFGKKVTIADKLSAGELGCAMSHLKIYEKIIEERDPYALILEDDCRLFPSCKVLLPKIIENADKWDIVQLAYDSGTRDLFNCHTIILEKEHGWKLVRKGMGVLLDPFFNRRRASYLACAYLINKRAASKLIELGYPVRIPADYLLGLMAYHKLRQFVVEPQSEFASAKGFISMISELSSVRPSHHLS